MVIKFLLGFLIGYFILDYRRKIKRWKNNQK